jgi:arylsulfatase A-like enzyme
MKIARRLTTIVLLSLLIPLTFAAPPNVILIMTDDQGYGDFGATGNELIRTPNIDAMAKRSTMMTTFYVSPVCSPTRASLMTGRYNYRTRCIDTWIGRSMMEPDEVTIAEVLSEAGYATGIFGKWHLGDSYPMRAIDQGFQEALIHRGGGLAQPADHPDNDRRYTDAILYRNGTAEQTKGYCTDVYFDNAIDFITRKSDSSEPFFTYIATNAPHGPYHDVPEELRKQYEEEPLDELFATKVHERKIDGEKDKLGRIASMITNVDDNVGKLFAFLEEKDLIENTLVIFLTDNGPNTPRYVGPFKGMKTGVHEGGVRTPLWLHWPSKFPAGSKHDQLAAHIDLMPTILEVCDVPAPTAIKFDGRSFLSVLENSKTAWPERTLTIQTHRGTQPQRYHHFMTRDNRWKLVHPSGFGKQQFEGDPKFELYDLENDPGERINLTTEKPKILERLKTAYNS